MNGLDVDFVIALWKWWLSSEAYRNHHLQKAIPLLIWELLLFHASASGFIYLRLNPPLSAMVARNGGCFVEFYQVILQVTKSP
jgi:hypothetical protein